MRKQPCLYYTIPEPGCQRLGGRLEHFKLGRLVRRGFFGVREAPVEMQGGYKFLGELLGLFE